MDNEHPDIERAYAMFGRTAVNGCALAAALVAVLGVVVIVVLIVTGSYPT